MNNRDEILAFIFCREHAEKAIEILSYILPEDHLLLSSSKRVKGTDIYMTNITYFRHFVCIVPDTLHGTHIFDFVKCMYMN